MNLNAFSCDTVSGLRARPAIACAVEVQSSKSVCFVTAQLSGPCRGTRDSCKKRKQNGKWEVNKHSVGEVPGISCCDKLIFSSKFCIFQCICEREIEEGHSRRQRQLGGDDNWRDASKGQATADQIERQYPSHLDETGKVVAQCPISTSVLKELWVMS